MIEVDGAKRILPPVDVPAAVLCPALRTKALEDALLVLTFLFTLKSPFKVLTLTAPVAEMPSVLPTVPMISPSLSV